MKSYQMTHRIKRLCMLPLPFLLPFLLSAQKPNIKYPSNSYSFSVGSAITTLSPSNSGGAIVPGFASSATVYPYQSPYVSFTTDVFGNVYVRGGGTAQPRRYPADKAYGEEYFLKITPKGDTVNLPFHYQTSFQNDAYPGFVNNCTNGGFEPKQYALTLTAQAINYIFMGADAKGNTYVAQDNSTLVCPDTVGFVIKIDSNGVQTNISRNAGLSPGVWGFAVDKAGNSYTVDGNSQIITKYATNGSISTFDISAFASDPFSLQTSRLAVDSKGNLYYSAQDAMDWNVKILKIDPSGKVSPFVGLNDDGPVAIDSKDNLYYYDGTGVYFVAAGTNTPVAISALGSKFVQVLSVDGLGNLYAMQSSNYGSSNASDYTLVKLAYGGFTVMPALPAGLTLDATTGAISGTPTTVTPATTYTIYSNNSGGTSITTLSIEVKNSTPNYTWTGAVSSDPSLAANWSNNVLPSSTTVVTIPANASPSPVLGSNFTVGGLVLDGTLSLNGKTLTINGPVSGSGFLAGSSTSSLVIGGTVGTLNFLPASNTLANLTVNSGSATIGNALTVGNNLNVLGGTLNTGGFVTLGSNAAQTAVVSYPVAGTINGNVIVERFVPKDQGAAFRDLGVSVTGATVANLSSQAYTYTNNNWTSTLAGSTSLVPGKGYRAQVNTSTGPVTLSCKGNLTTGNVSPTITQGSNALSLVANPYAAVLDFNAITKSGLQNGFWYFDPTNIVNNYQGYVYYGSLTGASNTYSGALSVNQYIQPSQAFFVQNTASGGASSLTFTPSATVSGHQYNVFGGQSYNRISTGLFSNGKNLDGAVAVFNNLFSNGDDAFDASKFSNQGENLTFIVNGKDLCANAHYLPTVGDVLPLHLYNLKANTTYTLRFDASEFIGNGLNALFQNGPTHTKTPLLGANNDFSFSTGSNPSAFANAFSIVFAATTLPLSNIDIAVGTSGNNGASVKWSTIGESGIVAYQVQRSLDGTVFSDIATVGISSLHSYSYEDASPIPNTGFYYRVKATYNDGSYTYSHVATVKRNDQTATLRIAPNPVSGNAIKLSGLEKTGHYIINITNPLGQSVYTTSINHKTLVDAENLFFTQKIAQGSYQLRATHETGTVATKTIIIQ